MAEEPENLILRMLTDIRKILDSHTLLHEEHRASFKAIRKSIDEWKETTAASIGFSAHANIRNDALGMELEELKKRVEQLERAH